MDSQLKKGLLDICVLACISHEESYGYKIIQDISPYIEITESTLYPILKRLVASGAATTRTIESSGRLRKYYSITAKGRKQINEFVDEIHQLNRVYEYIIKANGGFFL